MKCVKSVQGSGMGKVFVQRDIRRKMLSEEN